MPREYRHIKQYEKEMLEMKERGLTVREIGAKFGLTYEQAHDFFKQYNRKQPKLSSGESFKSRGRASKNGNELPPSIQQLSKLTQLQYILAAKERYIKGLEMENELMRDFLSHTEGK